ncbi:hypothetical protein [uncultured Roseovarius sp.]|uniref:hypothetical protein n=1 Tax=uncultured Roseovarius sp. TaxID=293344 RepID=UPI00260C2016|nr:hypothetical protein [uncultured Roseovarius sp.]
MAGTISKTKTLSKEDRDILRAIYFRQRIPLRLVLAPKAQLANRLKILQMAGLIVRKDKEFALTDTGIHLLKRAYGGKKPPMIDFKQDARLKRNQIKKEFIVGSSLAGEIAREASISE